MDPRNKTYVDPDDIYGDDLNAWQDSTVECRWGNTAPANEPGGFTPPATTALRQIGGPVIFLHHKLGNAVGEVVLDTSIDFRDRMVDGVIAGMNTQAKQVIGASYTGAWDYAEHRQHWYTGTGCVGAAPPTPVVGSAIGTYMAPVWGGGANDVWIYARNTDGALCAWMSIGADLWISGLLYFTKDLGGF